MGQEIFLPAFFFTNLLLLYTLPQLPHSIPFGQAYCISLSWINRHFLTFRSNQFSREIDSCWHGSDCLPNGIHVKNLFSVPTTNTVNRVGQFLLAILASKLRSSHLDQLFESAQI